MEYRLEYLPEANVNLLEAEIYLSARSLTAIDKFIEAIDKQTETLIKHPLMYPVYDLDNRFRLMPLPYQYLCFYRVDETARIITIHRVYRGMRDIPSLL